MLIAIAPSVDLRLTTAYSGQKIFNLNENNKKNEEK